MTRIMRLAFAGLVPAVLVSGTLVLTTPSAHAHQSRQPVASHPADLQNRKAQVEYRERLQPQSTHQAKAQIEHDEQR
jgi:hypothetical protein